MQTDKQSDSPSITNKTSGNSSKNHASLHSSERGAKLAKSLGFTSSRFQASHISGKVEDLIAKIKRKDRTYMKPDEWGDLKYYKSDFCEKLYKDCPDQIDRVNYKDLSLQDFIEKYEKPNKPLIITGLEEICFPINKYWTFEEIYQRYKDVEFKIGEDDDGRKLRIKLKHFFEYMVYQKDDSPLYLFESAIEDIKHAKNMISHYQVPPYFKDDIFEILGDRKRPPYRWFLIGPTRSGTTIHIDPLYTSAWNCSLQGHKRWVLFPEDLPKSLVKGKEFVGKNDDDEALSYFTHILPKIKEKEKENLRQIEFIQYPGDTVFVPGGWWHAVVNLDNTMALTQNFLSANNFEKVWRSLRKERKKLSIKLLQKFKEQKPQFYLKALELNELDGFIPEYEKNNKEIKRKRSFEVKDNDIIKKRKISLSSDTNESSSSSSSDSSSESSSESSESDEK